MHLVKASYSILSQLASLVEQIEDKDFSKPCPSLGNSSIGQHLRHTLEFFLCLQAGYGRGVVNYDKRPHDPIMEKDKSMALAAIHQVKEFISGKTEDAALVLEVGYEPDREDGIKMGTNYFRELTYNIEHAVHHMVIIKIGVKEVAPYVSLPDGFGIAASTIRYNASPAALR